MSPFVFASIATAILCSIWFAYVYARERYLFVKPSVVLLLYTHVILQWPMALMAGDIEILLPQPWDMWLLLNAYILFGIAIGKYAFRGAAMYTFSVITERVNYATSRVLSVKLTLLAIIGAVMAAYFSTVPLSETGLYVILTSRDAGLASLARETSLKLVEDQSLKYAFVVMAASVAPLLSGICLLSAIDNWRIRRRGRSLIDAAIIFATLIMVSITGARSFSFEQIVMLLFVLWFSSGLAPRWRAVIIGVAMALLPVLVLTFLREARSEIVLDSILDLVMEILERVMTIPSEVGLWYVHYYQTEGGLGIAAIPKLAVALGIEPIHAPNFIGLRYALDAGRSISANAGYLLAYYGYFGPSSVIPSLLTLAFLDATTGLYRYVDRSLLLPCVAAIAVSSAHFVSADFTVVLVTNGFLAIFALAIGVSRIRRAKDLPATGSTTYP